MTNYNQTTESARSRSDKILEARLSFDGTNRARVSSKEKEPFQGGLKHPFGLLRMLMAGMLFLVLVTAFHFQVSYHGFNKAYVQKVLEDDSQFQNLVQKVSQVMKHTTER